MACIFGRAKQGQSGVTRPQAIGIGLSLGLILGIAMDDIGLGLLFGVAIGAGIAAYVKRRSQ
jgi:hypothetical protein